MYQIRRIIRKADGSLANELVYETKEKIVLLQERNERPVSLDWSCSNFTLMAVDTNYNIVVINEREDGEWDQLKLQINKSTKMQTLLESLS